MLVPKESRAGMVVEGGVVPNHNEEARPPSLVEASRARAGKQGTAPYSLEHTVFCFPSSRLHTQAWTLQKSFLKIHRHDFFWLLSVSCEHFV